MHALQLFVCVSWYAITYRNWKWWWWCTYMYLSCNVHIKVRITTVSIHTHCMYMHTLKDMLACVHCQWYSFLLSHQLLSMFLLYYISLLFFLSPLLSLSLSLFFPFPSSLSFFFSFSYSSLSSPYIGTAVQFLSTF